MKGGGHREGMGREWKGSACGRIHGAHGRDREREGGVVMVAGVRCKWYSRQCARTQNVSSTLT